MLPKCVSGFLFQIQTTLLATVLPQRRVNENKHGDGTVLGRIAHPLGRGGGAIPPKEQWDFNHSAVSLSAKFYKLPE